MKNLIIKNFARIRKAEIILWRPNRVCWSSGNRQNLYLGNDIDLKPH